MSRKRRPAQINLEGAQTGDLQTGDVVGGSKFENNQIHITLPTPTSQTGPVFSPQLYDLISMGQKRLLSQLFTSDEAPRLSVEVAASLGWSHQDVLDELKELIGLGFVKTEAPVWFHGSWNEPAPLKLVLTSAGRKFCRNHL